MRLLLSAIFLSLFIPPDQPVLHEGYFAGVMLIVLGRYLVSMPKTVSINTRLFWLWGFALGVMVPLGISSVDRALSLLTILRYLEGFAAFFLASFLANDARFPRYMTAFGTITAACFLLFLFFPFLRTFIPPYNGILAINGHHPVIYTVLLTLPFFRTVSLAPIFRIITGSLLALTVLFSAARSAWIIMIGYFVHLAIPIKRSALWFGVIVLLLVVGVTTIGTATLSDTVKEHIRTEVPLLAGFTKDTNLVMRREYTTQALRAFSAAPLTGHGPGTFSLVSKTYLSQPGWFARYAHSYPLELLAETGVAGFIAVGTLIVTAAVTAYHAMKTKKYRPYGAAVILITCYSIIDTPLQSLPHWILFWMLIGTLAPRKKTPMTPLIRAVIITIWSVLTVFFITFIFTRSPLLRDNGAIAFRLAPYDPMIAMERSTGTITDREKQQLLLWHGADTEVLFGMAKTDQTLYSKIIRLAPKNGTYLAAYLARLAESGDAKTIAELLCNPSRSPTTEFCPLDSRAAFQRFIKETPYFGETLRYLSGNDGYGKFFYFLGVAAYTHTGDRDITLFLWQKAMESAPQWAFYYLEVAGAQYHWLNNPAMAKQTVGRCLTHPLAKIGCVNVRDVDELLVPMLYSRDIMRIPALQ